MVNVVWKMTLEPGRRETKDLPSGSQIIHVAAQGKYACVWFLCDPSQPDTERKFMTLMTGEHHHGQSAKYLGTALIGGGAFVLHVFEEVQ